jgi:hypothetical protein
MRIFFRLCSVILMSSFILSSNAMIKSDQQLKANLGVLAISLKELKTKCELLVAKLGLLKDRLAPAQGAPEPEPKPEKPKQGAPEPESKPEPEPEKPKPGAAEPVKPLFELESVKIPEIVVSSTAGGTLSIPTFTSNLADVAKLQTEELKIISGVCPALHDFYLRGQLTEDVITELLDLL